MGVRGCLLSRVEYPMSSWTFETHSGASSCRPLFLKVRLPFRKLSRILLSLSFLTELLLLPSLLLLLSPFSLARASLKLIMLDAWVYRFIE